MGRLYLASFGASTGCPHGKTEATNAFDTEMDELTWLLSAGTKALSLFKPSRRKTRLTVAGESRSRRQSAYPSSAGGDAPGFALRRREQDGLGTTNEGGGTAEKMRVHDTAPGGAMGRVRSTTEGVSTRLSAIGHCSRVIDELFPPILQSRDTAWILRHTEQSRNYWVKQLSKPSVISLLGRLRPMKTMRLSRFSSFFHGL
jgi:hypothetical protein